MEFAWEHLRMGLPMAVQFSVLGLGMIFIQAVCNNVRSDYDRSFHFRNADRTAGLAADDFLFGFVDGGFQARRIFGAHRFDRIREGVKKMFVAGSVF